jgi:hypothetical protein
VHTLDAIDLLLERYRYGGLDHCGVCAHVVAGDRNLWRRQVGIKRNGQARNADRPRKNNQQSAHGCENRPSYKKVNQTCTSSILRYPAIVTETPGKIELG